MSSSERASNRAIQSPMMKPPWGISAGRGEMTISYRPGDRQSMTSISCTNSSSSFASTFEDTKRARWPDLVIQGVHDRAAAGADVFDAPDTDRESSRVSVAAD